MSRESKAPSGQARRRGRGKAHALEKLTEAQLRTWLLERMRGEHEDPPVDESRLESPNDYVRDVHAHVDDAAFRARLERAVVAALDDVAKGDLRKGPDARAARYLASLASSLDMRAAYPVLLRIAERGALGGDGDALDPDTEEMVLSGLVSLQPPGVLWRSWRSLWDREIPRLWPVVSAGLRLSDARAALEILPEVVRRAERYPGVPLGEILWSYATDTREVYRPGDIAGALAALAEEALQRCRAALRSVGAEDEEIRAWVPDPAPGRAAWWLERADRLPLAPPRPGLREKPERIAA
jgi:hypothetical protein